MKKLTSLQVFTLMSLALGSSSMYGGAMKQNKAQSHVRRMHTQDQLNRNEMIAQELRSEHNDEKLAVEEDLAVVAPEVLQSIILEEYTLEPNFKSIKNFLERKNAEINKLNKQNEVSQLAISRLAVQLTDAQEMFEKTVAKYRSKNKHDDHSEHSIQKSLRDAQEGLVSLTQKSINYVQKTAQTIAMKTNKGVKAINKSMTKKKSVQKNDEVVIQNHCVSYPFC